MKTSLKSHLTVRIFAGILLSPEIRHQLHQNQIWKVAKITWQSEERGLQSIPYQNKDYLGLYLDEVKPTIETILRAKEEIRQALLKSCPDIQETALKLYLFPQVFIG